LFFPFAENNAACLIRRGHGRPGPSQGGLPPGTADSLLFYSPCSYKSKDYFFLQILRFFCFFPSSFSLQLPKMEM